jgi:hypothetical protein
VIRHAYHQSFELLSTTTTAPKVYHLQAKYFSMYVIRNMI